MIPDRIRAAYKRLERDDEYLARLRSAGYHVPSVSSAGALLDEFGDARGVQRPLAEDWQ